MSDDKKASVELIIGKHRAALPRFSYLAAFTPKMNRESNKLECSTQLLIPKVGKDGKPNPDVQEIKDAIAKIKNDNWLAKKKPVPPKWWDPLRDGDTDVKQNGKSYGAECKGHYVLSVKTGDNKDTNEPVIPLVVGTVKSSDGKYVRLSAGEIKSGDYGRITVRLVGYEKGTHGVAAYFSKMQLVEQGEALGNGGTSAEDDFSDFDDDEGFDPLA